ncbi:conjugal transfer protein TrbL [Micropruina sonneratiae]|uniref:conjugal transfer protein TrbL n=1 Tax=Micropruina sonneratiae TaxID=2986940 RepID=UPI0022277BE1|nr:conjugal transfer protein TrbL [Micropruina sp. KQZ13P-5]MCW3159572.1 conjugal transfer protein TrbL [Micropruina sp. KQZ13P-5]
MGVCDIPVISTVCDTAGEAAASLVAAPFDWLAQAMGAAAGWLFEAVWSVFDTTTLVDVTRPEYVAVYNLLFGIAVFVMLIFFCLQLLTGLIRRDPTALSRAALGLAKSVLGSFVVITLTALLLEIVDQLCVGIIQAAGETTESMGDKITLLAAGLVGINIAAPGVGAIITIFLAGLAIAAAAIVWLSLLVRKALLLVAIVFAPLAFSGASWDASRGWIGRWAMFVIALICSKLVLVVMFLVAITQVSAPIDGDLSSISDPLAGIVLMAMAAFAPYLTYKFISFIGFDMYHAIGSEQDAKQALNRPVPTPTKPAGDGPKNFSTEATAAEVVKAVGVGAVGRRHPRPRRLRLRHPEAVPVPLEARAPRVGPPGRGRVRVGGLRRRVRPRQR